MAEIPFLGLLKPIALGLTGAQPTQKEVLNTTVLNEEWDKTSFTTDLSDSHRYETTSSVDPCNLVVNSYFKFSLTC